MPLADVNETYTDIVTAVFSSTIAAKAWLATAAIILAVAQVTIGPRMFGKLRFVPSGRWLPTVHRWTGASPFSSRCPSSSIA